jgi:hypothetical protein
MDQDWNLNLACPWCGKATDGIANAYGTGAMPDEGSVTICLYCGKWAILYFIDSGLTSRRPTADELSEMYDDPDVRKAEAIWKAMAPTFPWMS